MGFPLLNYKGRKKILGEIRHKWGHNTVWIAWYTCLLKVVSVCYEGVELSKHIATRFPMTHASDSSMQNIGIRYFCMYVVTTHTDDALKHSPTRWYFNF
jgi:hypothetical protein